MKIVTMRVTPMVGNLLLMTAVAVIVMTVVIVIMTMTLLQRMKS